MGNENPSGRRPRRKSGGRRRRSGKEPAASDPAASDVRESETAHEASAQATKVETEARPNDARPADGSRGDASRGEEGERPGEPETRTPRRGRSRKRGGRSAASSGSTATVATADDSGATPSDRSSDTPVERPDPAPSSSDPAVEAPGVPAESSNGAARGEAASSSEATGARKRTRGGRRRRGKGARAAEGEGKEVAAKEAAAKDVPLADAPAKAPAESAKAPAESDVPAKAETADAAPSSNGTGDAEADSKPETKAPRKKRRRARGSRSSKTTPAEGRTADGGTPETADSDSRASDAARAGSTSSVSKGDVDGDGVSAGEESSSESVAAGESSANGETKPARTRSRRGGRGRRSKDREKDKEKEGAKASDKTAAPTKTGERLMLINTKEPEEVRVAILDDRELDDLLFESTAQTSYLNNIYLGRVVNIEPSIGAAFVDFGGDRNGFLHESDIVTGAIEANRQSPKTALVKTPRGERRPIQDLVRKGQSVLVQITKDGIGSKGPTLTTNISIPGRYLVLMPYLGRCGVSRKIPDKDERKRLKTLLGDLEPPADLGVIIRTAGVDRTKTELQKDLRYLLRLWDVISKRIEGGRAPATIYLESDLIIRTIRDYFTGDISRVLVDSDTVARKCTDFLRQVMPRYCNRVEHYSGKHPLFHEYGVEPQIEQIYRRRIDLPSGGSVVIEQTEALVAVDVNSGKYRENEDPEETAYRTDLEAIPVIVRQIRLRDLGGLLIIDFIDMQQERHRRAVERELRAALKRDRARAKMTRMSEFGIIEITRQRVRAGLGRANFEPCPHCRGAGQIKTVESQVLAALRQIRAVLARDRSGAFDVAVHPRVASALLNDKRRHLAAIEEEFSKTVRIHGQAGAPVEEFRVTRVPGS